MQHIHGAEGAEDRHRHGHAGDEGGPPVAQEDEDHQDHQGQRDQQRPLDVVQRAANGRRAVLLDIDIDAGRNRGAKLGQHRLNQFGGLEDIGAGLAEHGHDDRGLAVGNAQIAQILDRVIDLADIGQADRAAVAVGHDQRLILRRLRCLVVGIDLQMAVVDLDGALGRIGIGR